MANELRQFVTAANHGGNPQDDYNDIRKNYPLEVLKAEANFILEEQDTGIYNVTKKPDGVTTTQVDNPWDYVQDKEKVLIIRNTGVFHRFNFDFVGQFPAKYQPTEEATAPTIWTITFEVDGGSEVENIEVEDGQTATKPTDPTKENKTFGGWYTDDQLTEEFDWTDPVTDDITLYAKWE